MNLLTKILLPLIPLLTLTPRAHAATVSYYLSINDNNGSGLFTHQFNSPGQWTLYATVSNGDNYGLAAWQVTLNGFVSSIVVDAPMVYYHDSRQDLLDPDANPDVNAGFTLLRGSQYITTIFSSGYSINASQDTGLFAGPSYLIQHLGQASGNLLNPIPAGWDSFHGATQSTYYNVLKLAHGTYSFGTPQFVPGPSNNGANVFDHNISGLHPNDLDPVAQAQCQFVTSAPIFGDSWFINLPPLDVVVPEPTSLAFLALPAILLHRRRKPL